MVPAVVGELRGGGRLDRETCEQLEEMKTLKNINLFVSFQCKLYRILQNLISTVRTASGASCASCVNNVHQKRSRALPTYAFFFFSWLPSVTPITVSRVVPAMEFGYGPGDTRRRWRSTGTLPVFVAENEKTRRRTRNGVVINSAGNRGGVASRPPPFGRSLS